MDTKNPQKDYKETMAEHGDICPRCGRKFLLDEVGYTKNYRLPIYCLQCIPGTYGKPN
jgi:hypothetical protein